MLKHIYRFLGLVIVFVAALFLFGHNIEVIQVNILKNKVAVSGETLPIISMSSDGIDSNRLYGYVNNTPANSVRESITVLGRDKQLEVVVNECKTTVNKLNYEVRSTRDNELLDSGAVAAFSVSENSKTARIKFETDFEASTEYALKITLITDVSKKVNYYTRLKYYENDCHLKEKINFAMKFHTMTMKKDEKIAAYIETDLAADNSSLANVNINSSFENIVWGELEPEEITKIVPTVREINIESGAVTLDYYVKMNTETGVETYYVNEFYRIKYTEERMYLLWFERSISAEFDASLASINKNELKLGIMPEDEDIQLVSSDTANKVAFTRNGNVYMYDLKENKIYAVYQEYIDKEQYDHELYRQQNTHIISIDEEGNICFAVYGYIAHGDYEGKVAIILYRYIKSDNAIEELLYIPFQTTYQVLKENFEEYSYLNASNVFYFAIDDKIYSYNLVSEKMNCIAGDIGVRNFMIIPELSSYVWESAQTQNVASEITIMNLETEQTTVIPAGEGCFIRLAGVMGTNVVYGIGSIADISYTTDGAIRYPMKKIEVLSRDFNVIKTYSKKKVYITKAVVNGNVVELKRVRKKQGKFVKISDDNILNRMNSAKLSVEVTRRVTEKMLTEKYLSFPQAFEMEEAPSIAAADMFVLKKEKALYLEDTKDTLKYYVYAKGKIKESFVNPADAIVYADSEQGVVISSDNVLVWERGGRFLSSTVSGIGDTKTGEGKSSTDVCVYLLLNAMGVNVELEEFAGKNSTILDILVNYLEEPVNLTGCTLDEILYFVSGGKPVIAMKDDSQAVLIIAYTTTSVTIYDPSTGRSDTVSHAAADEMFNQAGNVYVSYVKGAL